MHSIVSVNVQDLFVLYALYVRPTLHLVLLATLIVFLLLLIAFGKVDATQQGVARFGARLDTNTVSFFYYSSHGVQDTQMRAHSTFELS